MDFNVGGFFNMFVILQPHLIIPFRRGVLDATLCDKVCQWLAEGWWFFPGTLISTTNKTDCQDITEIVLKVAFNTITLTLDNVHSLIPTLASIIKSFWFFISFVPLTLNLNETFRIPLSLSFAITRTLQKAELAYMY